MRSAHDNGIDSIGVLYGYGTANELAAARATHLVHSPEDITRFLLTQ